MDGSGESHISNASSIWGIELQSAARAVLNHRYETSASYFEFRTAKHIILLFHDFNVHGFKSLIGCTAVFVLLFDP